MTQHIQINPGIASWTAALNQTLSAPDSRSGFHIHKKRGHYLLQEKQAGRISFHHIITHSQQEIGASNPTEDANELERLGNRLTWITQRHEEKLNHHPVGALIRLIERIRNLFTTFRWATDAECCYDLIAQLPGNRPATQVPNTPPNPREPHSTPRHAILRLKQQNPSQSDAEILQALLQEGHHSEIEIRKALNWYQNTLQSSSPEGDGHTGLPNIAATCWLNASLHHLRAIPGLTAQIRYAPLPNGADRLAISQLRNYLCDILDVLNGGGSISSNHMRNLCNLIAAFYPAWMGEIGNQGDASAATLGILQTCGINLDNRKYIRELITEAGITFTGQQLPGNPTVVQVPTTAELQSVQNVTAAIATADLNPAQQQTFWRILNLEKSANLLNGYSAQNRCVVGPNPLSLQQIFTQSLQDNTCNLIEIINERFTNYHQAGNGANFDEWINTQFNHQPNKELLRQLASRAYAEAGGHATPLPTGNQLSAADANRLFAVFGESLEALAEPSQLLQRTKTLRYEAAPRFMQIELTRRSSYQSQVTNQTPINVFEPLQLTIHTCNGAVEQQEYQPHTLILHGGGDNSGHYTALRKHNDGSWYLYDDESVCAVSASSLDQYMKKVKSVLLLRS